MSLTAENITHIARLSRLKVNEQESKFYADQLNTIMELVDQLKRIDTDGIEPMSHPQDAALRLREDKVTAENCRDDYQAVAPAAENGLYLVPKVIE